MKKILVILLCLSLFACAKTVNNDYYVAYESDYELVNENGRSFNQVVSFELNDQNQNVVDVASSEDPYEICLVMLVSAEQVDEKIKEARFILKNYVWEIYIESIHGNHYYYEFDLKTHKFNDDAKLNHQDLNDGNYHLAYSIEEGINFNGLMYEIKYLNHHDLNHDEVEYPKSYFAYNEINNLNLKPVLSAEDGEFEIEFAIINHANNHQKVVEKLSSKDLVNNEINAILFYRQVDGNIHLKLR